MKPEKIIDIISAGENVSIEFKKNFSAEVAVSLNAFANTSGGSVIIGVDNTSTVCGVSAGEETIQNWVNEIKQKTEPSIIPDAEELRIHEKIVVILTVKEFPVKPVSLQGRYYKRIHNSNHIMSISQIADLHLKTFNSSWDYYVDSELSLDRISAEKIQQVIVLINRRRSSPLEGDVIRFLQKYELLRDGKLTKAAYLLFVDGHTALTGIQAGRFKSSTTIIDSLTVQTDLFTEVEMVMAFVHKHLMTEYIISGNATRTERYDYPVEAIREIVLNMIVHRDYHDSGDSIIKIFDDRIEFFNPGGLIGGITIEDLLSDRYVAKARNLLVNLMFKEAGLVEKYGSGISRILKEVNNHGNCSVQFEQRQHGFMVILLKHEPKLLNVVENVVENERKILEHVKKQDKISAKELAEKMQVTARTVQRYLKKLQAENRIKRLGSDKGGKWEIL